MPDAIETNSDEITPKKSSERIFLQELEEGFDALEMPTHRLIVSGFAAGLELGLSLLLIAVWRTNAEGVLSLPVVELVAATMSSFGFIAVILGRSELFTEQTTLAILPMISGNATLTDVGRLWSVVYVANIVGATLCAAFIAIIGPALHNVEPHIFIEIARNKVDHAWWVILLSGVLAGWLMGLLSWLVAAGRDTISQIFVIWIFTGAIGLAHLHHSILGATQVLGGVFTSHSITMADFAHFLLWATVGNAVGGVCFVALLKFGHARPGKHA